MRHWAIAKQRVKTLSHVLIDSNGFRTGQAGQLPRGLHNQGTSTYVLSPLIFLYSRVGWASTGLNPVLCVVEMEDMAFKIKNLSYKYPPIPLPCREPNCAGQINPR